MLLSFPIIAHPGTRFLHLPGKRPAPRRLNPGGLEIPLAKRWTVGILTLMKAQEVLGYIIAVNGGGLAALCAASTGFQAVMNVLPILRPALWVLSVIGLLVLVGGLAIAAAAEDSES